MTLVPVDYRGIRAGPLAGALDLLDLLARVAWIPDRPRPVAVPRPAAQFDLDAHIPRSQLVEGIRVRFGPVHTVFATATLDRTPTRADQERLADALAAVEARYPWAPDGVFLHVGYGLPYFRRLPRGLFDLYVPRLLADTRRFVLEEAVPAPHDLQPADPGIGRRRFPVPLRIEDNDLLITLRGDDPRHLADVLAWLAGSDLLAGDPVASPHLSAGLTFTSARVMFAQPGLPRELAVRRALPYAGLVNPRSPTWMGLVDEQPEVSAAPVVTFQGTPDRRLTTAQDGDYFADGAIQHLAHTILDLQQFYDDAGFTERVRCMFRAGPPHHPGAGAAERGVPVHQRVDGPGLDGLDVPGGASQPKLQFAIFVPTAELFAAMRRDRGDLDRFLTATRRQNFLVPPLRHRTFPLLELT
jgi:hypothetical protein